MNGKVRAALSFPSGPYWEIEVRCDAKVVSMKFDQELLQAALVGLEMKRAKLEEQIASVRSMAAGRTSTKRVKAVQVDEEPAAEKKSRKKRHKLSPEARQRMPKRRRSVGPRSVGNSLRAHDLQLNV